MLPTDQARSAPSRQREGECAELIRVRGLVQGVGFRPAVWRLAHEYGLRGWVGNDGAGVSALLCGAPNDIVGLVDALMRAPLALARIDAIEREPAAVPSDCADFRIVDSHTGSIHTGVVPDAAICPDCRQEILDPAARRFRYPFANCTQCGPRLSIIEAIPYDRGATTMRPFRMCPDCAAEYGNPADRRFHAQPIACPACGPRIWLEPAVPNEDAIEAAGALLLAGGIVAIKALGGFHLACDATNAAAVARLRQAKHRDAKPFALMARDIALIQRYARVAEADAAALSSPVAPIVLLQGAGDTAPPRLEEAGVIHSGSRHSARPVLQGIAPGLSSLGFMLPGTPLHHLLLSDIDRPLVMTSGNLSDEPQCITNDEARSKLRGIADHILLHDRDIARRVDDSVVRVAGGATRVLRRARGYAPAPLPLPHGFAAAPSLLAMGGELKSTFALVRDGEAVLSHHMGDLENAPTFADYRHSIEQYRTLFAHTPCAIAVDCHPDYLATKHGRVLARLDALPVFAVQHHHAHLAACMTENGAPLDTEPVLGIVLDGLGWGDDSTIWGGEFLHGDYRGCRRLACLKPVAMPGGAQAVREPWRNAYAQITAAIGWPRFMATYGKTELARDLSARPVAVLDQMIARGVNAPWSSSCGRLFDAVAAAAGLCRDKVQYEGQAAMMLEAAADTAAMDDDGRAYPFAITALPSAAALPSATAAPSATAGPSATAAPSPTAGPYATAAPAAVPSASAIPSAGLLHLDPAPLWPALLDDIATGTPVSLIAARFHAGLAIAISQMVSALRVTGRVALSGGVFQNKLLLEQVMRLLSAQGLDVLTHRLVPANDGGLALGQAAVTAARMLSGDTGES